MNPESAVRTAPKRKELDLFTRGEIINYHKNGFSYSKISKTLGVPISTIGDVISLFRKEGLTKPVKRQGRTKVFSERTKNAMIRAFHSAPYQPITVQYQNFTMGGLEMSLSTFRRRMDDLGLGSYPITDKPALTDKNKEEERE